MMIPLMDSAKVLVPITSGHAVSERTIGLIEAIRNYNSRLDVKWVPPEHRLEGEAQFTIIERTPDGQEHLLFHIKDESEFDGKVLERIIAGDTSRHDIMSELDAHNAAVSLMQQKAMQDQMDEASDKMMHVIRSPLHKYKLDKDTVINDYGNNLK